MSHPPGYRGGMNSKRTHTGFGLYDTARQIARRKQLAIERAENRPPQNRITVEQQVLRDLFVYARQFKRPLAA